MFDRISTLDHLTDEQKRGASAERHTVFPRRHSTAIQPFGFWVPSTVLHVIGNACITGLPRAPEHHPHRHLKRLR